MAINSIQTVSTYKKIISVYLNSFNDPTSSRRTGLAQWIDRLRAAKMTWQTTNDPDDLLYLKILCIKSGHQNRMMWVDVVLAIQALDKDNLFDFNATYSCFDDLYQKVSHAIANIRFARGVLTRYDISLHIALLLNNPVYPDFVYLAGHTRKSAENVGVKKYPYAKKSAFPKEFQILTCMQIEDLLCVYFKVFQAKSINITGITVTSAICHYRKKVTLLKLYRDAQKKY